MRRFDWTVIIRYPDGQICQHTFTMNQRDARIFGRDRAERDAKQFCALFDGIAEVLYCGRLAEVPAKLRQEVASETRC